MALFRNNESRPYFGAGFTGFFHGLFRSRYTIGFVQGTITTPTVYGSVITPTVIATVKYPTLYGDVLVEPI